MLHDFQTTALTSALDLALPHLNESGGLIKTTFPPAFTYDGLSLLLGRSVPSLQADLCRKPNSLPPPCRIPGTRQPIWLLVDVLAWIASHREEARSPKKKKRGRPTKTEQITRRQAQEAAQQATAGQEGGEA